MFRVNKKNNDIKQLDNTPITTVIGAEITFTGDIKGNQSIKIDGNVQGNIHIDNTIILGEKSIINGDLRSKNIVIFGNVTGNIYCNQLVLKSSGKVTGDIDTNTIEIEMGGKYNGKLKMNQIQEKKVP